MAVLLRLGPFVDVSGFECVLQSLTTIVEQKFQIEKLQLQAASSEVHTYIPPEQRPAAAPFDVVVSEVRLVELLKPDTANLADEQEKENIETVRMNIVRVSR